MPQFRICISGNHKPGLRTVDEAIKARMHLLPFLLFIPPEERDLELANKLQAEWSGILQWAINGCLRWQREGLRRPDTVKIATQEYMDSADLLSAWFVERCERDSSKSLYTIELYKSYRLWSTERGEFVMSMREFSIELADRAAEFGLRKNQDLKRHSRPLNKELHGKGFDGVTWRDPSTCPEGGEPM